MRLTAVTIASALAGATALGCGIDREAEDPGVFVRSQDMSVRCEADEGGNLHVRAPADARVVAAADAPEGAAAEITLGDDVAQMPRPIRPRSRSLGFIGDGKLNEGRSHGNRYGYGVHDDLLPPHAHSTGFTSSHGGARPHAPYRRRW